MGNTPQAAPARPRWRWLRRLLAGAVILLCLYTLFGFLLLPALVKSQAEQRIGDKLQRAAHIGSVEFNPFTLALGMHDFRLMEPDGKTVFASADALRVNLAAESLLQLAPVIQQLRLDGPRLHLVRKDAHSYNFDDILARLDQEPPSEERARFAVNNIEVAGGRIDFDDRPAKARHVVADIQLGVPFISSLPSQVEIFVQPLLSAKVNNTPFVLKGKARPFADTREATLALQADDVDLTRYLGYLPSRLRVRVGSGRLDIDMTASFRQAPDKAPALVLDGEARVQALQVLEPDGRPVLKLAELVLGLKQANVLAPRIDIARLTATGLQADAARGPDRIWNFSRLLPATPDSAPPPPAGNAPAAGGLAGVTLQEFSLRDAMLRYADHYTPQRVTLERFDLGVRKLAVDLQKRNIRIGEITSSRADLLMLPAAASGAADVSGPLGATRGQPAPAKPPAREGAKQAPKGVSKAGPKPGPKEASQETPKEATGARPYQYAIDAVRISGWSARLEDGAQAQPASTTVAPLTLTVRNLSSAPGALAQVALDAGVNRTGRLAAEGSIALVPLQADLRLDLKAVDLLPLQPYVTQHINLRMTRGNLNANGRLQLAMDKEQGLQGGFKGDAGLGNLATVEKDDNTDFLRWKTLAMSGVDLRLQPLALSIENVALDDFFARLIIDANGRINLQDVIRAAPAAAPAAPAAAAAPAPAPAGTSTARAPAKNPPITVRKVTLQGGRVRFTDNFIKPNYSASLSQFGGVVSGLSSDPASSAAVDLRGEVNNAPLSVVGRLNPLRGDLFLDLKATVRGMELAPLSPYSGRYVGYGIEKGKMSFEVAYRIEERRLNAENRLVLDQLVFGDRIDSPDAPSLPVRFAAALLSDSNGVIDINLPIAGSFDDPQFSVGGLLLRVLGNVIVKAASQPFRLLGAMFGGGGEEELSTLEFEAGRAQLRPDAESKLGTVARALAERPALKLDIAGRVDPRSDLPGLKRAAVDRKVRSLKARDLAAGGGEAPRPGSVSVTPEEYPDLLRRVYQEEPFDKPRNLLGLPKSLPVEEMERMIAEHAAPDQDDLVALGNQRAATVRNWLVRNGQVPAERIFLLAPRIGTPEGGQGGTRAELALH
ncbi:MAG TPA: DUF748 domain-containing protein [Noviherbaspirillum sp.]|jgi:hypothetical protein|uniref:DUF748 domain-containing protein n=1 Tax=Noviherbaspirillum sp. TaxID=1926288 RepID=UPI002F9230FA